MSDDDGPVGTREVAHRLFAAEFDDADFSYSESDEERAPNYVVTPTGARVNRLFLVGVLTEIEQVNEEVLRARVVDPTGPFVVYAGQYQPDELAFLEAAEPPMFVAVTGKARTFEPEDGDRVYTSVRPESISEVDADTRDRWVVQAVEQTVERVGRMAAATETGLTGADLRESLRDSGVPDALAAGIPLALDHYGTTGQYLDDLRSLALDAARVVSGDLDEVPSFTTAPDEGVDDRVPVLADIDVETGEAESTPTASVDGTEDASTTPSGTSSAATETGESQASEASPAETADPEGSVPSTDDATASSAASQSSGATADQSTSGSEAAASASDTGAGTDEVGDFQEADDVGDFEEGDLDGAASEGDGVGDFDTEFELDDEEREELESEFGTDFQSGTEVDEPGEAEIETPDPEELADAAESGAPADAADAEPAPESAGAPAGDEAPSPDADAATSDAPTETPDTATEAAADEVAGEDDAAEDPAEEAAEPAPDVDLEDAVMDAMADLDDGSGADREQLQATVAEAHGADPAAVADAIQDALMGGRCYEPEDGKLKPI